jgi:hypothetical protein
MIVKVILYSILRDKLPAEDRGRTRMELPDGASVATVMGRLLISPPVVFTVNDVLERDTGITLYDGDEVCFFRQSTGGSGL